MQCSDVCQDRYRLCDNIYTLQPILQVKNCRSKINVEKDTTN